MMADFSTILGELRDNTFDFAAVREMRRQMRSLRAQKRRLGAAEVKRRQGLVYRQYAKQQQQQREALARFRAWRETIKQPTTHD